MNLTEKDSVTLPGMLGLDEIQPGTVSRDRYFFASPLVVRRLALLNKLVGSQSSLVIVVLGERGSGKTALMNRFIADKSHRWQVCRIRLKRGTGIAEASAVNLHNRLVFISGRDSTPSVIVDDAHQLSAFELRLLLQSAFDAGGRRKLQSIVLFAEPSMRDRFGEIASALPPRSGIDKMFMAPLTEEQTAAYLEHRFRTAGYLEKFPFSDNQIRAIHQISRGLPGWINDQAVLQLKRIYAGGTGSGILSLARSIFPRLPSFRLFNSH
jgi:MSHA biogenesis protein MshM